MPAAGLPDKDTIKQKLILSKHFYDRTPSDSELRCLLEVMQHCKPAVAKIATTATDINDALRMLELPQHAKSCESPGGPSNDLSCTGCLQNLAAPCGTALSLPTTAGAHHSCLWHSRQAWAIKASPGIAGAHRRQNWQSTQSFLAGSVIALAMGERGVLSRLLASRFGAFLTFGALSKGRESAPGQPLISDLRARYHSQSQTGATKVPASAAVDSSACCMLQKALWVKATGRFCQEQGVCGGCSPDCGGAV